MVTVNFYMRLIGVDKHVVVKVEQLLKGRHLDTLIIAVQSGNVAFLLEKKKREAREGE